MIVCDICQKSDVPTFSVKLAVIKEEVKGKRANGTAKLRKRQVIAIPLDLCDKHITTICKTLGHLKASGILLGQNEKPLE